jgi:muconate cycloisomerase
MAPRIVALDIYPVRWPLKMKRRHGVGDIERSIPGVILRLTDSDGLVGWGEAAPWAVFSGTAEANAAVIEAYFRPVLLGAECGRITALMERLDHAVIGEAEAKAAIEMALFDLLGKRAGLPVHALLGGAVRDRIALSCSIANPDFAEDMAFADARFAEGVRLFKLKTGFLDPRADEARARRLRGRFGDALDLRIDYNQGLAPVDALRIVRRMEAFAPSFIEQPVPRDQRAALGAIAAAIDTPVMADESVFTPAEAIEMVRARFADCVAIKIMKSGGIARARAVAAIAGAAGIAAYGGTMFEGGIASAAGLHMVAATPNISLGAEFYTARFVMGVDVLTEPLRIVDGFSLVPQGPGLGIEVDEERLRSIVVAR